MDKLTSEEVTSYMTQLQECLGNIKVINRFCVASAFCQNLINFSKFFKLDLHHKFDLERKKTPHLMFIVTLPKVPCRMMNTLCSVA